MKPFAGCVIFQTELCAVCVISQTKLFAVCEVDPVHTQVLYSACMLFFLVSYQP